MSVVTVLNPTQYFNHRSTWRAPAFAAYQCQVLPRLTRSRVQIAATVWLPPRQRVAIVPKNQQWESTQELPSSRHRAMQPAYRCKALSAAADACPKRLADRTSSELQHRQYRPTAALRIGWTKPCLRPSWGSRPRLRFRVERIFPGYPQRSRRGPPPRDYSRPALQFGRRAPADVLPQA